MAVQQNKVSTSRRNKRRSHDFLRNETIEECLECGEIKRPHHICLACGNYKGMQVLTLEEGYYDEDDS